MITIIKTNKEKLHNYEFVKPIEKILKEKNKKYKIIDCKKINKKEIEKATHIIITGTSIKDERYKKHIKNFEWIKKTKKPILGICAGMQIIGKIYKGKIKEHKQIGLTFEYFHKEFLGIKGFGEKEGFGEPIQVYHLHKNYIEINKKEFDYYSITEGKKGIKIPLAIKHKTKNIYATLFHPEVRNEEIIEEFIKK